MSNLVFAQNGSFKPDTVFSFKSVSLGITPSEFRKATPLTGPGSADFPPAKVICISSDDTSGPSGVLLSYLDISKFLKDNGGDSCVYDDSILFFKYLSKFYGFYFIKGPNDTEPKLFNMWMVVNNRDYDELLSELKKKYGKPQTQTKALSNALNAKFLNVISTWENKINKITLMKYDSKIDRAKLEYVLKSHYKHYQNKKKEVEKSTPPKV